jgi:hypothetical protein
MTMEYIGKREWVLSGASYMKSPKYRRTILVERMSTSPLKNQPVGVSGVAQRQAKVCMIEEALLII